MTKCDCYHTQEKLQRLYHPFTGEPHPINITVGVCYGTKECDECTCGGDRSKCNFYPEIREKAKKENNK
jgi:hypothetical protein